MAIDHDYIFLKNIIFTLMLLLNFFTLYLNLKNNKHWICLNRFTLVPFILLISSYLLLTDFSINDFKLLFNANKSELIQFIFIDKCENFFIAFVIICSLTLCSIGRSNHYKEIIVAMFLISLISFPFWLGLFLDNIDLNHFNIKNTIYIDIKSLKNKVPDELYYELIKNNSQTENRFNFDRRIYNPFIALIIPLLFVAFEEINKKFKNIKYPLTCKDNGTSLETSNIPEESDITIKNEINSIDTQPEIEAEAITERNDDTSSEISTENDTINSTENVEEAITEKNDDTSSEISTENDTINSTENVEVQPIPEEEIETEDTKNIDEDKPT